MTQPSSFFDLPQLLVEDGIQSLQPFSYKNAGYLLENNKLIPTSEQIKNYPNSIDIFLTIHENCILENCLSSITDEIYPFS